MDEVAIGSVRPFPSAAPDKAQAIKVLEEAAEVFGAWQLRAESAEIGLSTRWIDEDLLEELADCITACANLAAALGVHDLRPYIERARAKNEERGRYAE